MSAGVQGKKALLFIAVAALPAVAVFILMNSSTNDEASDSVAVRAAANEYPINPYEEGGLTELKRVDDRVIDRTQKALENQLECLQPPAAGLALEAMINNDLVRETDGGGDGSVIYDLTMPIYYLGYPVLSITGWQASESGGAHFPFYRGPGTAPPNFISIVVRGGAEEVRGAAAREGVSFERYVPNESEQPFFSDGKWHQPQRKIPGLRIEAGDFDLADTQRDGVTTLTCSAEEYDF